MSKLALAFVLIFMGVFTAIVFIVAPFSFTSILMSGIFILNLFLFIDFFRKKK